MEKRNVLINEIWRHLENQLPDLDIYEGIYEKPYTKNEYVRPVVHTLYKFKYVENNKVRWDKLVRDTHLSSAHFEQYYTTFQQKIRNILLKVDEKVNKKIDSVITNIVKSQNARKPTNLQLMKELTNIQFTKHMLELNLNKYLGTLRIKEWLQIFESKWTASHDPQKKIRKDKKQIRDDKKDKQRFKYEGYIPYPFKSKYKQFQKENPNVKLMETVIDPKTEMKTLSRPYYSPIPGGWEIDHCFNMCQQNDSWMFCININTRYLVIYKINEKAEEVLSALQDLIKEFKVTSIRGDGSVAYSNVSKPNAKQSVSKFVSVSSPVMKLLQFYAENGIKYYFNSGKMTNHNRIIDAVIKTIRSAIGYRRLTDEQLRQIVDYYNNTQHRSLKVMGKTLTPNEMTKTGKIIDGIQFDPEDLEWSYIRKCDQKLEDVMNEQRLYGLHSYRKGNILMIHTELGKTADKHEKKRRIFDRIGEFVEYIHGNVRVILNRPILLSTGTKDTEIKDVIVPMYCTRFVANDKNSIPESVINIYGPVTHLLDQS